MNKTILSIWSGPRNISTALMYSFAQRNDTLVIDEPLYAHYLRVTKDVIEHPGKANILASMEQDGNKVMHDLIHRDTTDKSLIFLKQMAHHLTQLDEATFLPHLKNVLLIRNPYRVIISFAKVIPNPSIRDVGIKRQYELYEQLTQLGQDVPVLDSKAILLNPEGVLRKLCERIGVEFDKRMLHWQAGKRPEDGIWAKYWYKNVHQSTGFQPYKERTEVLADELIPLWEECKPYYDFLYEKAIR